ncbi:MAG TPA: SMP-30/gluconolactonase/LRE family protein [Gammaproteobacteria bacterium]|nr:SMP-30/gluconolactonase/LRE family protein [Gammaproteobacteria bacterium]
MTEREHAADTPGAKPSEARLACAARALLGEGPRWVERENALYWVDIKGKALHRLGLVDGKHARWAMPEMVGWIVERRDEPGFVAGFKSGFARLFLDPLRIEPICAPEPHLADSRMNDAGVDRAGCIWAGTMDDAETAATGCLYRLDPEGRCTRHDAGYVVSNGPTFSPDHDVLYHTDTTRRTIYRFALAPDGSLGRREEFVVFPEDWGWPDGMATDARGGVWVAHWGGARLSRFLPDGRLDRMIPMPVSQVTSCCFAGPALDRMFVTTASIGRESEALAGCLFEVEPGERGAPTYAYAG